MDGSPPGQSSCDYCGRQLQRNRYYMLLENSARQDVICHSINCVLEMIPEFFNDSDYCYDEDGNDNEYRIERIRDSKSFFAEEETED
jgi:hypothetical protein